MNYSDANANQSPLKAFFENRILFFRDSFNSVSTHNLWVMLNYLVLPAEMGKSGRPRNISAHIDSPGGEVPGGMNLLTEIERIKQLTGEPFAVYIDTIAASMASLMTQYASPGHLYMKMGRNGSQSQMLIHALSYGEEKGQRGDKAPNFYTSRETMANLYRIYVNRMMTTDRLFRGGKRTERELVKFLVYNMEQRDPILDPIVAYKNLLCDFIITDDVAAYEKYKDTLAFYNGFMNRRPSGDNGWRYEDIPVQKKRILTSGEEAETREKLIAMQKESYQAALKIQKERATDPLNEVLKRLDEARGEQGHGPVASLSENDEPKDLIGAAIDAVYPLTD